MASAERDALSTVATRSWGSLKHRNKEIIYRYAGSLDRDCYGHCSSGSLKHRNKAIKYIFLQFGLE